MRAAATALVLTAALTLSAAPEPAAGRTTITMSGSIVTRALVADLAYFYRHSVPDPPAFVLTGGITQTGISDTQRRITDGGLVARALTAADPPGLVLTRIARTGLCLATARTNPVPGLTRAQLQDIVAGRLTAWAQVPGSPRTDPIIPAGRSVTAGSAQVFLSVFVDVGTPLGWRPVTLPTDLALRDFIVETPAALGYVDVGLAGPLHVVAFDGVPCTLATIASGAYPAARPLGVVTRGRPRGAMGRFLQWVRTSATARRVIARRFLPG